MLVNMVMPHLITYSLYCPLLHLLPHTALFKGFILIRSLFFHFLFDFEFLESRKCEQVKQEMKNIRLELKDQQQKLQIRIKGQEELQALNDKGLGTVTTNSVNANRCLESPEINLIVPVNQSSELFSKHDKAQKSQEKVRPVYIYKFLTNKI